MVRDTPLMVMHPHTKYHWPISKDKKCYGPNKKILFKKQLFDLEVKGQDPTKVIMVCNTSPYGHAPTYQISLTYLERNNYLTLRSKDKFPRSSLRHVTHCLMVIHPHTKYHWTISRQKCYGPDKKIIFKKPLFDLDVKVHGPRKVIMVHDTPPCGHAPIPNIIDLSQKKQLFDLQVKGQGPTKVIMVCNTPPYGHAPTYQISLTSKETIIWPWGQRSRSKQRSLWYTTHLLWSCTHIPNIIDLSRKKPLFDLEVKDQDPRKVIMVQDTPPYGHAPMLNIIDLSQKKQLFDLQVKGQGPTKVIMVCNTPPYGHAPTYQISLTSRKKQLFDLEVKGQGPNKGHYGTRHTSYGHAPTYQISLTYLEINNYLTLRSKDKFPRSSLRHATHCLMVIHPHTKYHWTISRQKCYGPDKKIIFKKPLFDLDVKVQGPRKVIMVQHTTLWSCTHIPNIIDLSQKKQLFDLEVKGQQRSLWYATHHLMDMHPHTK